MEEFKQEAQTHYVLDTFAKYFITTCNANEQTANHAALFADYALKNCHALFVIGTHEIMAFLNIVWVVLSNLEDPYNEDIFMNKLSQEMLPLYSKHADTFNIDTTRDFLKNLETNGIVDPYQIRNFLLS